MAKRQNSDQTSLPNLIVSRSEAAEMIQAQIDKGLAIRNSLSQITHVNQVSQVRAEFKKWHDFNTTLLQRLFDNTSMENQYNRARGGAISLNPTRHTMVESLSKDLTENLTRLESIRDQLELIPERGNESTTHSPSYGQTVFIVHGHDEAAKESVARFIEKLGLPAIILHEQASGGMTLIEKFEKYTDKVGFAVVLLTPDDIGYPKDKPDQAKDRARQNVIFELGYFVGKLGRDRVRALYKGNVEILSDFLGVIYISMDKGDWKLDLAKEMKQSELDIDLNKLS